MMALRRGMVAGLAAVLLLFGAFMAYAVLRKHPQDLPWTELDLSQPVGLFTGRKLAALRRDFPRCERLMRQAGVLYEVLAPLVVEGQPRCGFADGVRLIGGGSRSIDYVPANLGLSCPVAAALAKWEWDVVQPAAQKHFGHKVAVIEHYGSYNCRKIVGRGEGDWSQHATANAVDIAGFRLDDATRITVLGDWDSRDPAVRAFLRDVRDGACGLFSTVLSPDYNDAHRNHFHLDQADRGMMGWRACR